MKRWTGTQCPFTGLSVAVTCAVVGAYSLAAALVIASYVWDWQGPYATRPVVHVVTVLCLLFAAACAGPAARHADGRYRSGWLALVVALTGWAAGEIIWAVYDVRPDFEHASHPAAAEVVLLLYPIGVFTAMLLLSKPGGHNVWRLALDGVIVAVSLFVACWVFVLDKLLQTDSSSRPTTVVHVIADVALMTTAILLLSRGRPGGRRSLSLLAGGVATIMLADMLVLFQTGIGSYHTGDLVDVSRVAGLGMMALAGLVSVQEPPALTTRQDITSRVRLWLPYLPLLLAAAVGLGHALRMMRHGPLLAGLGILVAAVLARQFVVLVENQGLLTEVAQEAFRDSLTGLANRPNFRRRLEQAVARRDRDSVPIAVMCLDLDNFKSVNDALGHPAGDELLVRVAGRLTTALGDQGTVARLGGDEFAVLIEGPIEESHAAAQRVLQSFNTAIVIDGVPLAVRPSIGFTVAAAESNYTVDELLRHSDLAMYAAKREGGQCIRSFVPDLPLPYALPELNAESMLALKSSLEHGFDGGRPYRGAADASPYATAFASTSKPLATLTKSPSEASGSLRWPPRPIRISLWVLGMGVLAFASSCLPDPHARHSPFFANVFYPALNFAAAILVSLRAHRAKADRLAWTLIAVGMAISATGDVIYTKWVPDGQSPSIADPAYLAFYPFVYAGLLLLMRARLKGVPVPVRLDSVVCGLVMASVAAALTAGPIHTAATKAPATVLVGLIYPWLDLVLVALAAGILPILGLRNEFRWGLLVLGFVLFTAADTAYLFETSANSYRVGTMLDAFWPASFFLIALASWTAWSSTPPVPKRGLGSFVAPVACTFVALTVTAVSHPSRVAATLAALSLIAIAARFSVTFRDVSIMAESHKQAMTDDLTALPNRRCLATALTAVPISPPPGLGPAPGTRRPAGRALLLLQLHEFDEIAESLGRHFGDDLMCQIANRLTQNVRREDLLARVGDDEFAILLAEGADLVCARAQAGRLLEALNEPFTLDPMTLQVDARIAIALFPDHCDHPQELLNRAEIAMPHARSAKSKIAVYDAAYELYRENDPNLIGELRAALADGNEQLTCHYQPKINASDGSVHSVEALLRWHHPHRGLLLPEEFLPAAERAGLMRKVANRTVNLALAQARSWREQGVPLTIAVNLSTTNLLDLDLVGTIEQLLQTHGLPADELIIEITESTLVDSARSRNTVAALQRLGVRISLDDYGTGWSSLARLQDVSVDELKLDRVFVARLAQDPRSVAIVRSTVALAESLGADLVAEGVEDEVTLRGLRQYGCTITQGFVHTPPLPAGDLLHWIAAHAPAPAPGKPEQAGVAD
ncbi:diguanylate cyclase domain-containing protein [Mycobacterium sp. ML4]